MPYTRKNIKDIPKWLSCLLCGNYSPDSYARTDNNGSTLDSECESDDYSD